MRLSLRLRVALILVFLVSGTAVADELFEINTSVRALGMGNAYLGVADNADALFYNPAGLARVSGFNWTIADVKVGLNGTEVLQTVNDIQGSATFEDTVRAMYGDHVWVGGGGKSAFTMPYFGAAIYNHLDASVDVNNPVYPNLDISVVNDYGYALGGAIPILPTVHLGTVIKYIKRTGSRVPFGATYIGSLDPNNIQSEVEREGIGYSMDLGMNVAIPGPVAPVLSFVWKDVGMTTFKPGVATLAAPPRQLDEMSIGAAVKIDAAIASITPAFDFKYLNRADVQLGKKLHFGVEIGLPVVDIRAGFSEGYYSLGAGVNLGIIRVDAASYGVELGEYPGQREDRRYIVQFTLELGFDPSLGIFGGGSGSGGKSGSGSGSGGGGPRLKRRR